MKKQNKTEAELKKACDTSYSLGLKAHILRNSSSRSEDMKTFFVKISYFHWFWLIFWNFDIP